MRSQKELFEYQISLERAKLEAHPKEALKKLSYLYEKEGLNKQDAHDIASKMFLNKESGLRTLVHEELGLDPSELGSPWLAAISSFLAFALGGDYTRITLFIPFRKGKSWAFYWSCKPGFIFSGYYFESIYGAMSYFKWVSPIVDWRTGRYNDFFDR